MTARRRARPRAAATATSSCARRRAGESLRAASTGSGSTGPISARPTRSSFSAGALRLAALLQDLHEVDELASLLVARGRVTHERVALAPLLLDQRLE